MLAKQRFADATRSLPCSGTLIAIEVRVALPEPSLTRMDAGNEEAAGERFREAPQ